MQNREDGGIPIELLLNCNRLQLLGATEELIVQAVQKSSLVKISNDGKAVLRSQPLSNLPPREKRTILVVGIPRWSTEPPQVTDCSEPDGACSESNSSELCLATWQITDWLHEVFSEFGQVLYVQLPHFQSSGCFRGFAFIEFADSKQAKAATNAFRPNSANQLWHVSPCGSNVNGRIPCPEHAWKPRLAAKATFAQEDMLARRYIWRCCSRKNKQIQSAMRQLRAAGYKAPNPFNREYELITIGDYSPEARQRHLGELFGTPQREKLCAFRYTTWQFWKAKFYEWHHAWVERMRRKTDELSIEPESPQQLAPDAVANANSSIDAEPKVEIQQHESTNVISLPRNFVPGTVIQIAWPFGLVRVPDVKSTSNSNKLILPSPTLSLARRIRISLEHHLLSSSNLLDQVAHVDPTPSDQVIAEVSKVEPNRDFWPIDLSSDGNPARYPVFVRFKTKVAAHQLIEFIEQNKLTLDGDISCHLKARVLTAKGEEAYCRAVAASLVGSNERRRRIQRNRRHRLQHQKGDSRSVDPEPMEISESGKINQPTKLGGIIGAGASTAKHIIFDS